jgi:hypothetical protein
MTSSLFRDVKQSWVVVTDVSGHPPWLAERLSWSVHTLWRSVHTQSWSVHTQSWSFHTQSWSVHTLCSMKLAFTSIKGGTSAPINLLWTDQHKCWINRFVFKTQRFWLSAKPQILLTLVCFLQDSTRTYGWDVVTRNDGGAASPNKPIVHMDPPFDTKTKL